MYGDGKLPSIDEMSAIRRPTGFDTDGGGIGDAFELEQRLDSHDPADRNGDKLSKDGYTNFEVYFNRLVPDESYLEDE
jgi:hypothetical protein